MTEVRFFWGNMRAVDKNHEGISQKVSISQYLKYSLFLVIKLAITQLYFNFRNYYEKPFCAPFLYRYA